MKRIFLSLLLVLCLSFQARAFNPVAVFSGKSSAPSDYSDIILLINAEGTWIAGTSYTLGATECSSLTDADDACVISNANFAEETGSPLVGSSSFKTLGNYGNCLFDHTNAMPKGRIGALMKLTKGEVRSLVAGLFDNSPSNRTGIAHHDADQVQAEVYDNSSEKAPNIDSTTADFDVTANFVEVAWDFSVGAGSDYVKLYVNGSLEDSITNATIDENMTWRYFQLGDSDGFDGDTIFDQVILSNDPERDLNALKAVTDVTTLTGACP